MECFNCKRTEKKIMLLKLPLDTVYENAWLEIMGNAQPNEYVCLACVGYAFDEEFDRLEFKLYGGAIR